MCLVSYYTLPSKNNYLFYLGLAGNGFFILPMIAISQCFAIKMNYPITEAMSYGIMIMFSQIFAIIFSSLGSFILEKYNPLYCVTLFIVTKISEIILSFFLKEV